MNILFLMKVYEVGGQEVVTATLAKCFVDNNHHVVIASFQEPNSTMLNRTDKRIKFYTIGNFENSTKNVLFLRQILIDHKIDIVINQWGLPYVPARVLSRATKNITRNIKIISIYHNSPDTNARIKDIEIKLEQQGNIIIKLLLNIKKILFKSITSRSMKYVYKHSNLYMVLSPSFINKFKEFTGESRGEHLVVLTNPVTIDSTNFSYSSKSKKKEIIYMGRIDYNQKRVNRVIDTWALLENKYPDWKLTIVGDGIARQDVEKQASDYNLKRVFFEGFQKPRSYYERASILILTSEYEGFPLVLAECMSFGVVPVVYGSYSAVYDIIKHGENGMITQPQNGKFIVSDMVENLDILMNDSKLRDKLANNAILTSSHDYSLSAIYKRWEDIFNRLGYSNQLRNK